MADVTIEKVNNGYVVNHQVYSTHQKEVFTSFEEAIEFLAQKFCLLKVGEKYRDRVFREELSKQQLSARESAYRLGDI